MGMVRINSGSSFRKNPNGIELYDPTIVLRSNGNQGLPAKIHCT